MGEIDSSTSQFYTLTPDVILKSLQERGFVPTGAMWKLNSYENRVFEVEMEDLTRVIVKYYRPDRWNINQIEEEHQFLFDLVESEIPVCAPLMFNTSSSLACTNGIYFAVWPRTGGRSLDEFTKQQMNTLGRLLGRIHLTGKKREAPGRLVLTSDSLGRIPLQIMLDGGFIPPGIETEYGRTVEEICRIYDDVSANVPLQRIHGDCHIGNLLHGDEGFFFLDFDDFYTGPVVQDFWMLIGAHDSHGEIMLNHLLDGYSMFSEYHESWTKLIEPLRGLRYILYAGWIARRWDDPAFKEAFPQFGTDEYWQNELVDLTTQLSVITKPSYAPNKNNDPHETAGNAPGDSEDELTNKDFFWDWEE
jgi:Ser/Thr protein kinase RdoA (MazF antagonist)